MPLHRRRLISAALGLPAVVLGGTAAARSTRITFILINDIYQMSDQMMPDGRRRGGFARLAAVVKAERAKGAHVLFAHAGDTLSPSLLSGIDRGEHIVTLTNLIRPDIFAPGNHEFDFGKASFMQRMAASAFPLYAANLRDADGQPLPSFKDRSIVTIDGVHIGLTGATYDDSARVSSPEDLRFLPTVATIKDQADALRREGADFVVAVIHARRQQTYDLFGTRTVDLILSGHTHDLFIDYDGRNGMVESSYDAHYVTVIDIDIEVEEEDGSRVTDWWPQFRVIDTATVTPDPEVAAAVAGFEAELGKELDVPLGTTAVELDSRTATVRTREAAIGDLITDAMRASAHADAAVMNGGGIRAGRVYAPGTAITRRDILSELPFGNRVVTHRDRRSPTSARARERPLAICPMSAAASRRSPASSSRPTSAAARQPHRVDQSGQRTARPAQDLSGRDQRFSGARRRRLRGIPRRPSAAAARRLAAARQRRDGLCSPARHDPHRRGRPDHAEMTVD